MALIAVLSAALWYGWFAWDTEYYYDTTAGEMAGPYAIWQGIGAFLCSFVVVGLAYRLLHFVVALLVLPAAFTAAWISTAAATDMTGLWAVGAVLVAVGTTLGSALMLGIAAVIEDAGKRHRAPASAPE
ncbi:hypothetical protein [Arthrobacter antioxidans]|uniref:hypothetical protein n=1 Tax=Arthrobacter antioxidans TaxID=2895818 RepID=UPI001FFFCAEA|nr:hypothetical protein [Arthrobacter antioxidans]